QSICGPLITGRARSSIRSRTPQPTGRTPMPTQSDGPFPPPAIAGVATAIAAFVGYTPHGPDDHAELVTSFADFTRQFGGLGAHCELSSAVQQFFANGGSQAYVVRTAHAQWGLPGTADLIGDARTGPGLHALDKVDFFNLLSIPDAVRPANANPHALDPAVDPKRVYATALDICRKRRAMLLVDPPPNVNDVTSARAWISGGLAPRDANAAAFFPRLRERDD